MVVTGTDASGFNRFATRNWANYAIGKILDRIVFLDWRDNWQLCVRISIELRRTEEYTLHIGHSEFGN